MFVVPLTAPELPVPVLRARARRRTRPAAPPTAWLALWLIVGLGVLAAIPAARGDARLGATLPFWLVAAPLLDLAWCGRAALLHGLRRLARPRRVHQVRVQARRWRGRFAASRGGTLSRAGRVASFPFGAGTRP